VYIGKKGRLNVKSQRPDNQDQLLVLIWWEKLSEIDVRAN
jgi:hypothetical protein